MRWVSPLGGESRKHPPPPLFPLYFHVVFAAFLLACDLPFGFITLHRHGLGKTEQSCKGKRERGVDRYPSRVCERYVIVRVCRYFCIDMSAYTHTRARAVFARKSYPLFFMKMFIFLFVDAGVKLHLFSAFCVYYRIVGTRNGGGVYRA